EDKHRAAMLVEALLKRPDRLIGLILLGNNLVNIFAASLATVIAMRMIGEVGIAVAPILLTAVVLIFAEVAPKTLAALYPERIAFPAAYILTPLGKLLYPFVWVINKIANSLLRLLKVNVEDMEETPITREELRTVVLEAGHMIPSRHQKMLVSILDLENITIDEIMVPRAEVVGIDLNDSSSDIIELLSHSQHTRLPVYRDSIDQIIGILHARKIPRILKVQDKEDFSIEELESLTVEPYFAPLGTPLHTQLLNFQRQKRRIALVVDEYGDIQGLVTLEDILEEIVGEFTTDMQSYSPDIHPQEDGSYIIDGTAMLREINRQLDWELPVDGPKTLNGLIIEHMQSIPEPGTSLRLGNLTMTITQAVDNAVKKVRVNKIPQKEDA
ncbi:MAG: HlyC/CorC family transporter, partial [Gammaproteobacteria bacterium]|nr:HlyC/CorC family transporter [Gammaproteobacteria bacterium]